MDLEISEGVINSVLEHVSTILLKADLSSTISPKQSVSLRIDREKQLGEDEFL
ncbi:uncharacterized protein PHALS_00403 [Plasmopara halstedii]|uniref:Uncharacterized protein n=1 Tax=Plasmopara halstedii TaxID=4781 RepID=A0A0N7L3J9_PLAHL|nr:uncharacterized protein PHALS_00403 [Plasmopara halstedii]CEG36083.1 hypothetical protein PHALS_00403 [Plasmopara halstedii]|eukprot:XP_024572452.1 hypothetical protein PHALS_00403 [Plasmopara halstedii]